MSAEPEPRWSLIGEIRAHPWIAGLYVALSLVGVGLALWLLPEDWALGRRIAAGVFSGAGCAWMMTVTRHIG